MVNSLAVSLFTMVILFSFGPIEGLPADWQSRTSISSPGFTFSPLDDSALFLSEISVSSLLSCTRQCHSHSLCRIFDFDSLSTRCRLFQGDLTTMGQLLSSASSSRVGFLRITSDQFVQIGQSCSMCVGSRYLSCQNGTCQCPSNTYYDGSVCRAQKVSGQPCQNASECRSDLNQTCLPRQQCGPVSLQSGETVAGSSNGVSGSGLSTLNSPVGIALGSNGSLYVADYGNDRVLRFEEGSLTGDIVAGTGLSGLGLSQLNAPSGLHLDNASNLYVVDALNDRVMLWRCNASFGIQIAGTGLPGIGLDSFLTPSSIVVDSLGNFYVSDVFNHRVMRWPKNGTAGTIVAGTGLAGSGSSQLNRPYGLALDESNAYLYIADCLNNRIQRVQLNVSTIGVTVAGGNGAGTGAHELTSPIGIRLANRTQSLYIGDYGNQRIQLWHLGQTSGVTIAGVAGVTGTHATLLDGPIRVFLNLEETFLYVSDFSNHRVQRFRLI